jgi:hypothetical protein
MTNNYANQLLKVAESQLGYTEGSNGYTKFGQWYQDTHAKQPGFSNASWCDMFVSWSAKQVGQEDAVGHAAWTVDHAKWFEQQGAWGTTPKPGAIVFYDWQGSKDINGIDHVGMVKSVTADGKIQTIEGNVSNAVVAKTRTTDDVVGYGYPDMVRQKIIAAKKANGGDSVKAQPVTVKYDNAQAKAAEHVQPVASTGAHVGVSQPSAAEQLGHPEGPMAVGAIVLPALALVAIAKRTGMDRRLARAVPSTLRRLRRDADTDDNG